MKYSATLSLLLLIVLHFQSGRALSRVEDIPARYEFEETCKRCVDPEHTVLCGTLSRKCEKFFGNENGQGQRSEVISLLRISNHLFKKSLHTRRESTTNECISFRTNVIANTHICEHIFDAKTYSSNQRDADFASKNSEADNHLPAVHKRILNAQRDLRSIAGRHFQTLRVGKSKYRSNVQVSNAVTSDTGVRVVGKFPIGCGCRAWKIHVPNLPRQKAIKVAAKRALRNAARRIGKGAFKFYDLKVKVLGSGFYLVSFCVPCSDPF